jgi:hypothetical protein
MTIFSSRLFIVQKIMEVFLCYHKNDCYGWVRTPLAGRKGTAFLSPAPLEAAENAENESKKQEPES